MRAVVQRVATASVRIDGDTVAMIEKGVVVLLGIRNGDRDRDVDWMAAKLATLRIFPNEAGAFDRSLVDISGSMLIVSQFTLYGDTSRGRRPSFSRAAPPEVAEPLYQQLIERVRSNGISVSHGRFGAHMEVDLVNDGPVTLILESPKSESTSAEDN